MTEVSGTITNIRFRNNDNGWTVLALETDDGKAITAVGNMPVLNLGEKAVFTGEWTEHPLYGRQIRVSTVRIEVPTSVDAVLAYLSSGFIKGIGKATARMIVDHFGAETLDVIKNNPEKLLSISGIGPKKLKIITDSYQERIGMQEIVIGLQQLGFSLSMALRIYRIYGDDCVAKIRENPYRLIDDVENIGFKTADKIAREAGIEHESMFRIKAGVKYALSYAANEGNTCLPLETLVMFAGNNVLSIDLETVEAVIEKMIAEGELSEKIIDDKSHIFLRSMFYLELNSAVRLSELQASIDNLPMFDVSAEIERLERKFNTRLASAQREAIERSLTDGVIVITGGPGTGKTTILRFIIEIMENQGMELELCAPTGRAAKRITETTGREARTVHRLLEYNASDEAFARNDENPLELDALIIDEMSMVDVPLFNSLLKAIPEGTRLIMVGDVDQLPSVGPGSVLKDIVDSDTVPVIRLTEIFRQAGRSRIVTNAHLVNNGRMPILDREEEDFEFYNCPTADIALESVLNLCGDYAYLGKANEVQVLSPMKANALGVVNLNHCLQSELNPPSSEKNEITFSETVFRVGDRVMQQKNNYDIVWTRTDAAGEEIGAGVFNGDIGTIMEIDEFTKTVTVLFDDERSVDYAYASLDELELAYCISVHKSQGSEFPCVVLPLVSGPALLFNRNILYTAITRATEKVVILGTAECVRSMINNTNIRKRYTSLRQFLIERKDAVT